MADESTKPPKQPRVTLTVILPTEEDRQLKKWMELELAKGKYSGTFPDDMTLSEFALRLLRAQRAAYAATQRDAGKKRKQ